MMESQEQSEPITELDYEEIILRQMNTIIQTINIRSTDVLVYGPVLEDMIESLECILVNEIESGGDYEKEKGKVEAARKELLEKYGNAQFGRVFWYWFSKFLILRFKALMRVTNFQLPASLETEQEEEIEEGSMPS